MDSFAALRRDMVERQLAARGIADRRVLAAMGRVPREGFVDPKLAALAYEDRPLPIGEGQTISQPYIVAVMSEAAAIRPGDRVLEVGTGSGYGAAVLAALGAEVFTIERNGALAGMARRHLADADYGAVTVVTGDGSLGLPPFASFDAIIVTAGGPEVPPALLEQLRIGGRLIMPVGRDPEAQQLIRVWREGPADFRRESLAAVRFVPLIGAQGWPDSER